MVRPTTSSPSAITLEIERHAAHQVSGDQHLKSQQQRLAKGPASHQVGGFTPG